MKTKMQMIFVIGIVVIIVTAGAAALLLTNGSKSDSNKVQIVASFYPLGYLAKEIGGDKVEVNTLISENTEVHSWSPSVSDIMASDRADIFLYNGAGLDQWVDSQLIPSIDDNDTTVVKTSENLTLSESVSEVTRLFISDNDNNRTLVYDVSSGEMVLLTSFPFGLNVVSSYSGYFDSAIAVTNLAGYQLLFIPNPTNVTVLNTGLHGEHFHDPEIVTVIVAGKPLHSCISGDGRYVAFALDGDNAALVIDVEKPADYDVYQFPGSSANSHATVVFDDDNNLYFSDMSEAQGSNLMIVDVTNGTPLVTWGDGGKSPHGGIYSNKTDKVYINCADGIAVFGNSGLVETIPYAHEGGRFTRSWVSQNGTWLISYVGDTSMGLAYSKVIAYDLVTKTLAKEVTVLIPQMALNGWPASIFLAERSVVAISDPQNGTVLLIDMITGKVDKVDLVGTTLVSMRLVEDPTSHALWAVSGDGKAYRIDLDDGNNVEVLMMETDLGENIVMSAVSFSAEHDGGDVTYDPHTWISPYLARQQAEAIYDALMDEDPANADYYTENWQALDQKLSDLDERYHDELQNKTIDTIFVSHEAYGYLSERYGFEQEGVIGISAEEQPSSSAMAAIVEEMIGDGVYVIYLDPIFTDTYVNTLKSNVESLSGHSVQILKLYVMTGTVDGKDYLQQMESNLESLKAGMVTG